MRHANNHSVIFGEIVPQSVCVRFGLPIGAWMSPFVLGLMYLMSPIAWPTAKLLDWLLGEDHGTIYKKSGLKTLVSLHRSMGEAGQRLHADEVTIISAVLDLKEKTIGSIMTPMEDVFTLSLDDVLDEATMDDILSQGYSRVPVHHPDNDEDFVGMLLVKMLITYDPEDAKPVREFALATLPESGPTTSCLDIVNFFQEGKSHMVLVSNNPGGDHGAIGVVTLEDVIEELIGEEIIDESDVFVDVHKAIRRLTPAPRNRFARHVSPADTKPLKSHTDLVDISEDQTLKIPETEPKRPSTTEADAPKNPAGQRRLSGSSIATDSKIKRGSNKDDVKEHLKHLGPSNLASRPKTTRYASVKIKPGTESNPLAVRAVPTTNGRMELSRRISETHSEFNSGIGEGVVKSAARDASDGVMAVAQNYGAIGSPVERRPTSANKAVQAESGATTNGSHDKESESLLRPTIRTNESQDDVADLPEMQRSKSPYLAKGPARSGSITENFIDSNGVRKVVLEFTSSSESNGEEDNSGSNRKRMERTSSTRNSSTSKVNSQQEPAAEQSDNGNEDGSGKKRRRRKKRGGHSKTGEEQPLLSGQK